MAHTKGHYTGVVWLHCDKVVGDDSHDVSINAELMHRLRAWVDQSYSVRLARRKVELAESSIRNTRERCQTAVEVVLSIDEGIV